jgi:hypothetical protein
MSKPILTDGDLMALYHIERKLVKAAQERSTSLGAKPTGGYLHSDELTKLVNLEDDVERGVHSMIELSAFLEVVEPGKYDGDRRANDVRVNDRTNEINTKLKSAENEM